MAILAQSNLVLNLDCLGIALSLTNYQLIALSWGI